MDGLGSEHRRPRTALSAVRLEGRLEAPRFVEGTCETVGFSAWLHTRLCPRLNARHRVILDHATVHRSSETAPRIAAPRLFLPSYAPGFNPTELVAALKNRGHTTKPLHSIKWSKPITTSWFSHTSQIC